MCSHGDLQHTFVDLPGYAWSSTAANTAYGTLYSGEEVEVTCWYTGNTADGYWDHVVWENDFGYVTGHVDDDAVNFNGQTPNHVSGLHRC